MGAYIFRFPAEMPKLTFEGLSALPPYGPHYYQIGRIGGTVRVYRDPADGSRGERFRLMLYSTTLASIGEREVHFTRHGDTHQATRMWLQQIVVDNGLGSSVYRNRKGVLMIDNVAPLEGHTYAVGVRADRRTNG